MLSEIPVVAQNAAIFPSRTMKVTATTCVIQFNIKSTSTFFGATFCWKGFNRTLRRSYATARFTGNSAGRIDDTTDPVDVACGTTPDGYICIVIKNLNSYFAFLNIENLNLFCINQNISDTRMTVSFVSSVDGYTLTAI